MTLLIAGLALWCVAHFFKRLAPNARANLGDKGKGPIALAILASVVLMVLGYRGADLTHVYDAPSWGIHLNNTLMLVAVLLMGMGQSKGRMRSWLRHPMLTGVVVWAIAHLLVNGDMPSLVLFGGLALWAIAEMMLINRAEGPWTRPEPGPAKGDLRLIIISLIVFVAIAFIHNLVGPWPFPQ